MTDGPDGEVPSHEVAEEPYSPTRRWFPSRVGGIFYLAILGATIVGLGIVASGAWRNGVRLIAAGLIVAAVLRLVLPEPQAGMLAVRHRLLDATILAGLGVAIVFLASSIPNQPPL
jgi:hypothetical protein